MSGTSHTVESVISWEARLRDMGGVLCVFFSIININVLFLLVDILNICIHLIELLNESLERVIK